MYQEAETGIFKPVLGALGVASVFLTIVGNLVFSPKPSSLTPTSLKIAVVEPAPPGEPALQSEVHGQDSQWQLNWQVRLIRHR